METIRLIRNSAESPFLEALGQVSGGLAICKDPESIGTWLLIHTASGLSFGSFDRRKYANSAREELLPLFDWTRGETDVNEFGRKNRDKIRGIVRKWQRS